MNARAAPRAILRVDAARLVMKRHARSFSWAAPFLPRDARDDAAVAYAFCRAVDDLADDARTAVEVERARAELRRIRAALTGQGAPDAVTAAYLDVVTRRGIDASAAVELVDGALSDLDFRRPDDGAALLAYCHAVAGTVGLMMCAILGARGARARAPAAALGIAMQLTNIARDVAEDAARGRTYLPRTWCDADDDEARRTAVSLCLACADDFYRAARAGLPLLPARARLGVLVAGRLYRAIGVEVRRLGRRALTVRAVVPAWKKALLVLAAVASWLSPRPGFGA